MTDPPSPPAPPAPPPASPPAPPPPAPPPATKTEPDLGQFVSDLDTKLTAWGERMVAGIREAFPAPAPPPATPPATPPKDGDPPKEDPPKKVKSEDPPTPGKRRTLAEWWFST
jgi:hypothetical protein